MKKRHKTTRLLLLSGYLLLAGAAAAGAQLLRPSFAMPIGAQSFGLGPSFSMPQGSEVPRSGAPNFGEPVGIEQKPPLPHPILGMPIGSDRHAPNFAMPQGTEYFGVPR